MDKFLELEKAFTNINIELNRHHKFNISTSGFFSKNKVIKLKIRKWRIYRLCAVAYISKKNLYIKISKKLLNHKSTNIMSKYLKDFCQRTNIEFNLKYVDNHELKGKYLFIN